MNHTENINTGIIYLSLPDPQIQFIKPQQSLDYKYQIEQDISQRYQNFSNDEFNHIDYNDAQRYKISYENLYKNLLESMFKIVDINEEILQIKHSIKYNNEILPILIQNHQLAKQEKKFLYNIITTTWQIFNERIKNEINIEEQLKQIKNQHGNLLNIKIQQEQYQIIYVKFYQINNEITYLKREIQQLSDYKHRLENEISEIQTHYSHNLIQINYIKTNLIRYNTNELNNLQLERDSIITQIELIKYNLFEQKQEYESIVYNYRQTLNNFRLTLNQLEQELKQQTNIELNSLQISLNDDTEKLIEILERKIKENFLVNNQLEKFIEDFNEKIFKQKKILFKKEQDYQTMNHIDQQLNYNIKIYREINLQLKIERRTMERQLTIKLKEYTTDDRLKHTLIQQHDSLLARKKLEQIRTNTLNEQLNNLIDENIQLKNQFEQYNNQYKKIHSKNLLNLQENIHYLEKIQQICIQNKISDENIKINYENLNEQIQQKNTRISFRINEILLKLKSNNQIYQNNNKYIEILENKLNKQQSNYHQEKNLLKQMINHSQSYKIKQNLLKTQIQIISNNIQNSQYHLKTYNEQLFLNQNNLIEHKISLNKLYEFYSVLKQQNDIYLKKISILSLEFIHIKKQYKYSQKLLEQTNKNLIKYINIRSILSHMIIRRINLCQLLYKKLSKFQKYIPQHKENIHGINKSIKLLIIQIQQIKNKNKKIFQKQNKIKFQIVNNYRTKIIEHSYTKQRRNYLLINRLSTIENFSYLKTKYYLLKNRLLKLIIRGIICNLIHLSLQQEFFNQLKFYLLKSNRKNFIDLNFYRTKLYQLKQQIKAKTAENNMLIDYQYYFQITLNLYYKYSIDDSSYKCI